MRSRIAVCCMGLLALSHVALARDFEVRLLKGRPTAGVWGTSEYSAWVSNLGVVRHVKVRGKEVLWQAVALYTAPVPAGEKRGVRTVQGEGFGKRGLSVLAPKFRVTPGERGARVFEYEHLIANRKVMGGKPLCKAKQKIVLTPTGEIHVTYDFEWLQTLQWRGFGQYLLLDAKQCAKREFIALTADRPYAGVLAPGPLLKSRLRSKVFEQLTVHPEVGPVHFVWRERASCGFYWPKTIHLSFKPLCVPYRGSIYKGAKGRLVYSILLPVSQQ